MFKVLIVGDKGVGKTTLIHTLTDVLRIGNPPAPTEVIQCTPNYEYLFHDTPGGIDRKILLDYVEKEGIRLVIAVFDCQSRKSYDNIEKYTDLGPPDIIVLNKSDYIGKKITFQGECIDCSIECINNPKGIESLVYLISEHKDGLTKSF
jgi:GTPase SAR1 family protein